MDKRLTYFKLVLDAAISYLKERVYTLYRYTVEENGYILERLVDTTEEEALEISKEFIEKAHRGALSGVILLNDNMSLPIWLGDYVLSLMTPIDSNFILGNVTDKSYILIKDLTSSDDFNDGDFFSEDMESGKAMNLLCCDVILKASGIVHMVLSDMCRRVYGMLEDNIKINHDRLFAILCSMLDGIRLRLYDGGYESGLVYCISCLNLLGEVVDQRISCKHCGASWGFTGKDVVDIRV